jgi:hypothetical protein
VRRPSFTAVDVILMLLIVVAVVYVGRLASSSATVTSPARPVTIQFRSAKTRYAGRDLALLRPGEEVWAAAGGGEFPLGRLRAVRAQPILVTVRLQNGQLRRERSPENDVVLLTVTGSAAKEADGSYLFGQNRVLVGQPLFLRIGILQLGGSVTAVRAR